MSLPKTEKKPKGKDYDKQRVREKADKIYFWLLDYMVEYCEENADEDGQLEELYEMVWKKFQYKNSLLTIAL